VREDTHDTNNHINRDFTIVICVIKDKGNLGNYDMVTLASVKEGLVEEMVFKIQCATMAAALGCVPGHWAGSFKDPHTPGIIESSSHSINRRI
jgi:hypothetical protein